MATTPPFTKVLDAVATHAEMFALFNRIPDCHPEERISGRAYVNQWFEIERSSYEIMLEVLPPLFMRRDVRHVRTQGRLRRLGLLRHQDR